ncbi:MAG: InlB B-repeat-containing protein, partial [Bacilli bacterium]|nr:InlB B-repeat-containing protein [Bacilli bacterium]
GWYTAASGGAKISADTKITGNTTFYAHWIPDKYTVTFNANGGSGAPGAQTKVYGTNLTLSSAKPTRSSYTFTGWNTKADGTGTSYASGGTYTANSAVTLYAQWKLAGYTITWNGNGGNVNGKTSTTSIVNVGSTLGTLPTATRSNYQFLGWFTKSSSTDANIASVTTSTKPSGNTTYYALWSAVLADSKFSYTLDTKCSTGCVSSYVDQSIKDYGVIYLVNGDKVKVMCSNSRHSGTNYWDALSKNRVPLQWYGPRSGASTTLTFTYDGSQNGTWSCDKYYYEYAGSNSERQLNYYKQNYASVQAGAGYMGSSGSTCYGQCDRVTFQSGHNYVVKWVDYNKTTVEIKNGGNPVEIPEHVERDTKNYSFQGWYTGPNGTGTKIDSNTRLPQNDVTYYAYWVTITGNKVYFTMKTTPPIANYGTQYVSIGDKVTISCYNQKAPGTYYKNHLHYNGVLIASGSNKNGASASTTFIFDGSQAGYYECGLTWSEYHRFENYRGTEGMVLAKK